MDEIQNVQKDSYLVIDGNSILNRAYYGIMARMTGENNEPTNAVYGFLNIYYMILEKFNPKYITVTFDLKAPTFRHKMYDGYKAQRKPMPEDLKMQMPLIKEVLRAMNVHIIEKEGFEADDIIGTVSALNEEKDIFTYILTGDRDSFQLISSKTNIIMPHSKSGKTTYEIVDEEALMQKYGITPNEVVEVKALMGDASDNIPGVPGIGEKTGYSLIQKYHSIDYIYENFENVELKPKQRENIGNNKELAYLSKTLAKIDRTVPLNEDYLNNAILEDVNLKELFEVFTRLKFSKFAKRYDFSTIDKSYPKPKVYDFTADVTYILSNDNIQDIFEKDVYFYLDLEKQNICFYIKENNRIYVLEDIHSSLAKDILKRFAVSKNNKYGYKIKDFLNVLLREENISAYDIVGFIYDIDLAYYLISDENKGESLEYIAKELLDVEITENTESQISLFDVIDEKIEKEKNEKLYIKIMKSIYYLVESTKEKLKEENQEELFNNIEMPLCLVLADMETNGIYIDLDMLNAFDKEITEEITILENNIHSLAGEDFNINSSIQLGKILFEKLNIPYVKKGKSGNYSTDKEVLEQIENEHEIVKYILEYRTLSKLKSTYVDGLRPLIKEDGRLHTTFMQSLTQTGRLSSVNPNLQNIPARGEVGKNIRKFFVATNGNYILDADYSQIELRVLAHIAKDKTMLDAFNSGIDIHSVTASQVFNTNLEDITDDQRRKAKAVNFGIVYGISSYGLAKNISVSNKEAKEYIDNYLDKYKAIHSYMEESIKIAREKGYSKTLFGRTRKIPELFNKNKMVQQFGERIAMNSPIQGTAADIIKLAMVNIFKRFKEENIKSKMLLQVHDELLFEVVEDELEKVKEIVKYEMENVIKLDVKLEAEPCIAKSWFDAK